MEKTKILYVDDEAINLMLFNAAFGKFYEVLTCESGMQGLVFLAEHPDIRVVVSDMRMPVMNGLQFISKAKEIYPDIIYFILTGYSLTEDIYNALKNGLVHQYFQKPFKIKEINEAIMQNLSN